MAQNPAVKLCGLCRALGERVSRIMVEKCINIGAALFPVNIPVPARLSRLPAMANALRVLAL